MLEDFAELVATADVSQLAAIMEKFPSVKRWNREVFRGAITRDKAGTQIHHIIPEAVLKRLKEFPGSQFDNIALVSLPGHAWRGTAHQAFHNTPKTGMNPALLNNAALAKYDNPEGVMKAVIQYYTNNEQESMAKLARAWSKAQGIPMQ